MYSQPKKELIENIQHGTTLFPFACYIWNALPYASRVNLHWHHEVELIRVDKGTFAVNIDMQENIVNEPAFLLIPGNIMHTLSLPANCQESAVVFDLRMLNLQNYDEVQSELFEPLLSGNIPIPKILTHKHEAFQKVDDLYSYCLEYGNSLNPATKLKIKSKLLEIIAIYYEYGLLSRKQSSTTIKRTKQDKLKNLLTYIDSHYAGPLSVKDAAKRLGITEQYFCRFFKRVTGFSFTTYLNDLRVRRAAREIKLTNRSVFDIASEHGFDNTGYFYKVFKQKYGMTPLRYRRNSLQTTAFASEGSAHKFANHDTNPEVTNPYELETLEEAGIEPMTLPKSKQGKNKVVASKNLDINENLEKFASYMQTNHQTSNLAEPYFINEPEVHLKALQQEQEKDVFASISNFESESRLSSLSSLDYASANELAPSELDSAPEALSAELPESLDLMDEALASDDALEEAITQAVGIDEAEQIPERLQALLQEDLDLLEDKDKERARELLNAEAASLTPELAEDNEGNEVNEDVATKKASEADISTAANAPTLNELLTGKLTLKAGSKLSKAKAREKAKKNLGAKTNKKASTTKSNKPAEIERTLHDISKRSNLK